MYCTNCGARLGSHVNFCARCGTAVERSDERGNEGWDSSRGGGTGRGWEESRQSSRQEPGMRGFDRARRKAEEYIRDPSRTQELITNALNKARSRQGNQGLVDEVWEYLQDAGRMLQATIRGEYTGLSGKNLLMIVGALLYFVSPIDFLPDILGFAGFFDDFTVLAFALRSLRGEIDAFKEWERQQGRGPRPS